MSFVAFSLAFLGASHAVRAAQMDTGASDTAHFDLHDTRSVLANTEAAFRHWLTVNARPYATSQPSVFAEKMSVFQANALHVHEHNSNPHATFSLHLNEFADLTFEEFQTNHLGYKPHLSLGDANQARIPDFRHADVSVPDEIDWTTLGAVTPVKNQGACGSCWAFSTTGAIEGADYLTTKKLRVISEQELVDCDREQDAGCGGGLMDNAFKYVVENGGIDSENDYRCATRHFLCVHLSALMQLFRLSLFHHTQAHAHRAVSCDLQDSGSLLLCCAVGNRFHSAATQQGT